MKFLGFVLATAFAVSVHSSSALCAQEHIPNDGYAFDPHSGYGFEPHGDLSYRNECCPVDCCKQDKWHFKVYADYLYWQVSQDQMQFATVVPGLIQKISGFIGGNTFTGLDVDANIIEQSSDWKSGFRIGAETGCPCDWGINLAWTHFNHSIGKEVSDAGGNIVPTAFPLSSIVGFLPLIIGNGDISILNILAQADDPSVGLSNRAKSDWSLQFNTIDLQFGKICCCSCLTLHPFIGLKAASILQSQKIRYFFNSPFSNSVSVKKTNDFRAIGPSIGLDAALKICENVTFSTGASGALVYGKFNARTSPTIELSIPNDTGAQTVSIAIKANDKKHNRLRPTASAYFGLDWSCCYCGSPIEFGVAYEVQYWWNQWQSPSSAEIGLLAASSSAQGDLMMQGVTFSLAVGF